MDCRF